MGGKHIAASLSACFFLYLLLKADRLEIQRVYDEDKAAEAADAAVKLAERAKEPVGHRPHTSSDPINYRSISASDFDGYEDEGGASIRPHVDSAVSTRSNRISMAAKVSKLFSHLHHITSPRATRTNIRYDRIQNAQLKMMTMMKLRRCTPNSQE
jgi:hypothetical protein